MSTGAINHKRYCKECHSRIVVIEKVNRSFDAWMCPKHGEQESTIIKR
jgi:transcriptional regulator NrdR family protein